MDTIERSIDLDELVYKAKESLNKNGYFIAKKLINPQVYKEARLNALKHFDNLEKNHKNLSYPLRGYVSAGMHDVDGLSRNKAWYLFRSCFFTWNRTKKEIANITKISRDISSIRNLIKGLPKDYGKFIEEDSSIAYTSLSIYPKDGGFLRNHKDGKESNILHFKVELTHKGTDYKEGGFYIFDKKHSKKIDISSLIEPCDVAFFDGSQSHGIDPIYGDKGRVAFFEIPTVVNNGSRSGIYTNDGWSLVKRAVFRSQLFLAPKIKFAVNKIIKYLP